MTPEERDELTKQGLPMWVSDDQWRSNPNINWWKDREAGAKSLAQQKPVTFEQMKAQANRIRAADLRQQK